MTAAVPARAPTPRLKAAATTSTSSPSPSQSPSELRPSRSSTPATVPGSASASAPASSSAKTAGRSGHRPRPSSTSTPASTDFLSDKSTSAFVRRVLCPQHLASEKAKGSETPTPVGDLLPPLTSRNDVDLQLYALLAVILRDYVQSWYNRITPDETFVAEVVQIIAHCTRALEQRLRKVDLESLFFDGIPDLVDRHITAYRTAHDPVVPPPTQTNPREVYHALCPLAPLSPVPRPEKDPQSAAQQQENEALYCQLLVEGVLAVLLPTEDLENGCLTSLVGQIFSELIIGNIVVNKLSQPWLIWECLIILARVVENKKSPSSNNDGSSNRRERRKKKGTTLEENVVEAMGPKTTTSGVLPSGNLNPPQTQSWSFSRLFWSAVQWIFLAFTVVKVLVSTLASSSSLPARSAHTEDAWADQKSPSTARTPAKVPIVTFKLWTCIADLIELDARMPWLGGGLAMLQLGSISGPGQVAALDRPLDRLLSHAIHTRLLDPSHLPPLLRAVRGALFPNNAPGASTLVAPSSEAQLRALKHRCASALLALVPRWLSRLYLGGSGLRAGSRGGDDNSARYHGGEDAGHNGPVTGTSGDGPAQDSDSVRRSSAGGDTSEAERLHAVAGGDAGVNDRADVNVDVDVDVHGSQDRGSGGGRGQGHGHGHGHETRHGRARGEVQADGVVGASGRGHRAGEGEGGDPITNVADKRANAGNDEGAGQVLGQGQGQGQGQTQGRDSGRGQGGIGNGGKAQDQANDNGCSEAEGGLGDEEQRRILSEVEEGILDVFSDEYCNKHLVYGLLELVLVRLVPELSEKRVAELWEERLS